MYYKNVFPQQFVKFRIRVLFFPRTFVKITFGPALYGKIKFALNLLSFLI